MEIIIWIEFREVNASFLLDSWMEKSLSNLTLIWKYEPAILKSKTIIVVSNETIVSGAYFVKFAYPTPSDKVEELKTAGKYTWKWL